MSKVPITPKDNKAFVTVHITTRNGDEERIDEFDVKNFIGIGEDAEDGHLGYKRIVVLGAFNGRVRLELIDLLLARVIESFPPDEREMLIDMLAMSAKRRLIEEEEEEEEDIMADDLDNILRKLLGER